MKVVFFTRYYEEGLDWSQNGPQLHEVLAYHGFAVRPANPRSAYHFESSEIEGPLSVRRSGLVCPALFMPDYGKLVVNAHGLESIRHLSNLRFVPAHLDRAVEFDPWTRAQDHDNRITRSRLGPIGDFRGFPDVPELHDVVGPLWEVLAGTLRVVAPRFRECRSRLVRLGDYDAQLSAEVLDEYPLLQVSIWRAATPEVWSVLEPLADWRYFCTKAVEF